MDLLLRDLIAWVSLITPRNGLGDFFVASPQLNFRGGR